jgi:hypothetical protein
MSSKSSWSQGGGGFGITSVLGCLVADEEVMGKLAMEFYLFPSNGR